MKVCLQRARLFAVVLPALLVLSSCARSANDAGDVASRDLAAGSAIIAVTVTLPEGYEINADAPSRISFIGSGTALAGADLPGLSLRGYDAAAGPLKIPVELHAGAGSLTARFSVYYCRSSHKDLCFIYSKTVNVAVRVSPSDRGRAAAHTIPLTLSIVPEAGSN